MVHTWNIILHCKYSPLKYNSLWRMKLTMNRKERKKSSQSRFCLIYRIHRFWSMKKNWWISYFNLLFRNRISLQLTLSVIKFNCLASETLQTYISRTHEDVDIKFYTHELHGIINQFRYHLPQMSLRTF